MLERNYEILFAKLIQVLMQGKDNYNFEKAFIDQSWAQLRAQLDEKMPISASVHKHRKYILLLSSLLVLSIAATAYFAYQYTSLIPTAELTKEHIIYRTKYLPEHQSRKLDSPNQALTRSRQATILPRLTESEARVIDTQAHRDTFVRDDLITGAVTDHISILPSLDQSIGYQAKLIENNSSLGLDPIEPKQQINRDIKFNLGIAATSSTDMDFTGYGVSSGIEIPVGKRFGINTGLALSFLSREHYFIPGLDRKQQSLLPVVTGIVLTEDILYSGLKNMKQFFLPVSLNYALTDELQLNSGVKLRYTYSEDVSSALPLPNTGRNRPIENRESIFNNTNVGLSAGFRYQLNKHFSILLDSEWAISSLISNSKFNNTVESNHDLNLVNLSTNYTF